MALETYRLLVDQICEQTLIPNPAALYERTNLTIHEVNFTLRYLEEGEHGTVVVHCDFGALPTRGREAVLLRLLETNFYAFEGPSAPVLSFSDQTQRVVLSCKLPLVVDASIILFLLSQFADMAKAWRADFFLSNDKNTAPAASATRASTTLTRSLGAPVFR